MPSRTLGLVIATALLLASGPAIAPAVSLPRVVVSIECVGAPWTLEFDPPLTSEFRERQWRIHGWNYCTAVEAPGTSTAVIFYGDSGWQRHLGNCLEKVETLANGWLLEAEAGGAAFAGVGRTPDYVWHFEAAFVPDTVCDQRVAHGYGNIGLARVDLRSLPWITATLA